MNVPASAGAGPSATASFGSLSASSARDEVDRAQSLGQRWQIRLELGQVIILWSVLLGTMVMVFMFGLHAGRDQGIKQALEEYGTEAVRLPLAQAVAPSADGPFAAAPTGIGSGSAGAAGPIELALNEGIRERAESSGRPDGGENGAEPAAGDAAAGLKAEKGEAKESDRRGKVDGKTAGLKAGAGEAQKNALGALEASGRVSKDELLALEKSSRSIAAAKGAEIDFSKSAVPPAAELSGKPVLDIFKDNMQRSQPAAAGEEVAALVNRDSLGSSVAREPQEGAERPASSRALLKRPESASSSGAAAGSERENAAKGAATESAPAAKATKPASAPTGGKVAAGWYLQVAAARTSDEAQSMMRKLQRSGFAPQLEEALVGKNRYYRVVVGPFPSKEAASAKRASVRAAKAAVGEPFVRKVD